MNINKRGGAEKIGAHVKEYCEKYSDKIRTEINIINPDIVIWIGAKSFDWGLHTKYLGAVEEKGLIFFEINGKRVPIIRMWHTSYYRARIKPLEEYDNAIIGKLCAKLKMEMKKYEEWLS